MSSWRESILSEFIPNVCKLTIVNDPDCLLTEEKLALDLRAKGFDLIEFNDSIDFRYAYESKYRSIWDNGEHTDLVVVLRLQNSDSKLLPYDLIKTGRSLSFNLGDLFPNFSYPIMEKLDRSLLDGIFDAQYKFPTDRMGENPTKDYILRHIYGVAAELINSDSDLLRALLGLHYKKTPIPSIILERFVQLLEAKKSFQDWPLNEIINDANAFFSFLQERWPAFLDRISNSSGKNICEKSSEYALKYNGPIILPFEHHDVRVYIDNLFVEGKLKPIKAESLLTNCELWIRSGIETDNNDDENIRIEKLLKIIEVEQLSLTSRHSEWVSLALKWAEVSAAVHCSSGDEYLKKMQAMGDAINTVFADWLTTHFDSLINLPPNTPAMLHHIPRRLVRDMEKSQDSKIALLVIDGLSLDQWVTIRKILKKQDNSLTMRESATFAWVPTLTAVSRQAIFAGKAPYLFTSSINTTANESKLWKQFWESNGLNRNDIAYQKGLSDGEIEKILDNGIDIRKTKIIGLVVDKIDKIMHGMQLGSAGMHNQIKQWCNKGFLASSINYLLNNGYDVWLTSDHGNIECCGAGRPAEGVLAETRGERVRIYPTSELRSNMSKGCQYTQEWNSSGLPLNYLPLVASNRIAFISNGETIVGHGGITVEEVIVPLIKFERNLSR